MKIVHNTDNQQITFLDERYYFDPDSGQYFPSVTTVLDVYPKGYGFNQWLKDLGSNADEVVRRAADQGSKVHNAIDALLNGNELSWTSGEAENFTLDEWMMLLRFKDFYDTYKPETISVENSLVCPELGIGGTLDFVCRINGQVWYIDWKSGGSIYKVNEIQGATYKQMWNSIFPEKIERVGCMHLRAATKGADKTGKQIQGEGWKLHEVEDTDHLFKLFLHAQNIWNEENPNPKPKNMIYPDRISIKSSEVAK